MDAAADRRDEVLRLFLQHQVAISGFLFALTEDWELAEEALQETAVFICDRWSDFAAGTNFAAWARSVARNRAHEVLHRKRRGSGPPPASGRGEVAGLIDDHEWEEHGAFSARHKEALSQCLNTLPVPYRQLVDMRYRDRRSCTQIADHLRKTLDAVYKTLSRIRERLKECMERRLAPGA